MTWASRVFSGYANRDGSEVGAERLRRRRTVWRDGGRGRETGCQWEDCGAGLPHAGFWVPGRRQARARHLPILPLAAVDTQVQPGCNRICSAYQFSASAECRPLFDAVKKKMILKQKKRSARIRKRTWKLVMSSFQGSTSPRAMPLAAGRVRATRREPRIAPATA